MLEPSSGASDSRAAGNEARETGSATPWLGMQADGKKVHGGALHRQNRPDRPPKCATCSQRLGRNGSTARAEEIKIRPDASNLLPPEHAPQPSMTRTRR